MVCPILKEYFLFNENNYDIEKGMDSEAKILMTLIKEIEIWNIFKERNFEQFQLEQYFSSLPLTQRSKIFKFGISCFVHFVQANFTGPEILTEISDLLNFPEPSVYITNLLNADYEEINPNTKFPLLLFLSKSIFNNCKIDEIVNLLWYWRSLIIHQQVMDEPSPFLLKEADELMVKIDAFNLSGYTKAKFDLEFAHLYLLLRHITKSNEFIDSAENILGITYNVGGKLGRRTKYQERDLAQMTLEVTLSSDKDGIERPPVRDFEVAKDITLDDDVRLDKVKFVEPQVKVSDLPNTEQKVILTRVQEMIIAKPKTDLIKEEILPYIDLILNQKNTWTVRIVALLLRCKYENSVRTIGRKISQCEEILGCFKKEKPHVLNRFADVFSTGLKPIWKVQADYAEALRLMGLIKDALNIFLNIQDWDSVIVCYSLLRLRHKAAEVIREQLAKRETPRLLCLLGDATDDSTCYEKAWVLSNEKSYMAKRHLGNFLFERKEYEKCIPHFEKSVSLNPLQPPVWLRLGFAALQTENWQTAATAYIRYTHLEPEEFQAWNNLAQAYIKMGHNREAHNALTEALKYNFENWQIWENYLIVSCDISSYSNIIRAYHKILDLEKKYINIAALKVLVSEACSNEKQSEDDEKPAILLKQTRELFGRITSIDSSNGNVWELYANICPSGVSKVEKLQKALRAFTQLGWNKDPQNCVQVLCLSIKILELVLDSDLQFQFDLLNSVRLSIKSALVAVKKHNWEETSSLEEKVSGYIDELTEKVKQLKK